MQIAFAAPDPFVAIAAGVAAVAPVILRWLNPKDSAFGLFKP